MSDYTSEPVDPNKIDPTHSPTTRDPGHIVGHNFIPPDPVMPMVYQPESVFDPNQQDPVELNPDQPDVVQPEDEIDKARVAEIEEQQRDDSV